MELERKERVERLMELVKELPKNQCEVVRLRFHHYHSYQKINEITGLSVGNVGFLLNAAMRNLRGKDGSRRKAREKINYLKKRAASTWRGSQWNPWRGNQPGPGVEIRGLYWLSSWLRSATAEPPAGASRWAAWML